MRHLTDWYTWPYLCRRSYWRYLVILHNLWSWLESRCLLAHGTPFAWVGTTWTHESLTGGQLAEQKLCYAMTKCRSLQCEIKPIAILITSGRCSTISSQADDAHLSNMYCKLFHFDHPPGLVTGEAEPWWTDRLHTSSKGGTACESVQH